MNSAVNDTQSEDNCGIDSLLQTMRHIKEMASDEITEDEMTQRFEKVENQNADRKFCFCVIYTVFDSFGIISHVDRP